LVSRVLKDLVPQKRVAAELGVSRSSLWRAMRSDIAGFPAAIVVRSRLYWRQSDLPALQAALDKFRGRKAFEQKRRHAKAVAARAKAAGLHANKRKSKPVLSQPDLFGEADAALTLGAGKGSPP
jgi:predicted DNA-binding transcriptional regulator AlpA